MGAEINFMHSEVTDAANSNAKTQQTMSDCNCLPLCTSLTYETELSLKQFKDKEFLQAHYGYQELKDYSFTKFLVFFKEGQFIAFKRYELYGPIDFLANCGGLLGLCMGFSLLSLIELMYFCSVRFYGNLKMRYRNMGKQGVERQASEA